MKLALVFALWAVWNVIHAQPLGSASVEKLVEQLAQPEMPKTRSLRNLTVAPQSVDLVVQFDFDSARLQESAKPLLNNLASAMKSDRLMNLKFSVEGHTDAKGTEAYNMNLSLKRAQSVVQYLIDNGVEPDRLGGIGKGFSELLYPDRPQAPENRRVRVTAFN
jgi:outer membrane protein OmpA-like peptidoglycan-associated protein